VEQQVVEGRVAHAAGFSLLDAHPPQPERASEPHQIHEAVPAHGQGTEMDRDRLEIRMAEHAREFKSKIEGSVTRSHSKWPTTGEAKPSPTGTRARPTAPCCARSDSATAISTRRSSASPTGTRP